MFGILFEPVFDHGHCLFPAGWPSAQGRKALIRKGLVTRP